MKVIIRLGRTSNSRLLCYWAVRKPRVQKNYAKKIDIEDVKYLCTSHLDPTLRPTFGEMLVNDFFGAVFRVNKCFYAALM